VAVNNTAVNLGNYEVQGVDFEADYRLPMQRISNGLNGDLSFRLLASLLYDMTINPGDAATVQYAGQSGPTAAFGGFNTSPRWQANLFTTYGNGPFTTTLQIRYVGPGKFEAITAAGGTPVTPGEPGYLIPGPNGTLVVSPNSINTNSVSSATYVNLSGSYNLNKNVSVFATIDNLLNKDPPVAPGGNGYPTNPVYFDTYGMTWKLGFRVRY
jgi:outer membrane receptor protein involved in Fe transport